MPTASSSGQPGRRLAAWALIFALAHLVHVASSTVRTLWLVAALAPLLGRSGRRAALSAAAAAGLLVLGLARVPRRLGTALWATSAAALAWLATAARARESASAAALRQAEQRLREHEAYLLGASHELRSPLSKATMVLEYLLSSADEANRAIGQAALFELHRLMVTLENMLELARIRSGHMAVNRHEVDVVDLVRQRVHAAEGDEAGHVLALDSPAEPTTLRTDPARLAQVIDNLLSNAIKYSPEETEVRVRVAATPSAVTIAVCDRGQGIAPEDRERIFEQYYRASNGRQVSGVGLGLFITRALVTVLGGRIEVESEPGRGSEFRVVLPRQVTADAAPSPTLASSA